MLPGVAAGKPINAPWYKFAFPLEAVHLLVRDFLETQMGLPDTVSPIYIFYISAYFAAVHTNLTVVSLSEVQADQEQGQYQ